DPGRFAGDVEYRIEKADVREAQPAGYHVAGWLLGNVAGVDGTAAEYAEQFDLKGDDWMNLLAVTSCGSMGWGGRGDAVPTDPAGGPGPGRLPPNRAGGRLGVRPAEARWPPHGGGALAPPRRGGPGAPPAPPPPGPAAP